MKKFLMVFIAAFTFMASTNAFAISDDELIESCLEKGKQKLETHARVLGCNIDVNEVEASGIDNRWYNPSKYIWYSALVTCDSEFEVTKLVQYYAGKCL